MTLEEFLEQLDLENLVESDFEDCIDDVDDKPRRSLQQSLIVHNNNTIIRDKDE